MAGVKKRYTVTGGRGADSAGMRRRAGSPSRRSRSSLPGAADFAHAWMKKKRHQQDLAEIQRKRREGQG